MEQDTQRLFSNNFWMVRWGKTWWKNHIVCRLGKMGAHKVIARLRFAPLFRLFHHYLYLGTPIFYPGIVFHGTQAFSVKDLIRHVGFYDIDVGGLRKHFST